MARRNSTHKALSELQEQIINALYILKRVGGDANGGNNMVFTGKAIAEVMGGNWTSYRIRTAKALSGWVNVFFYYGTFYYQLTPEAITTIEDRMFRGIRRESASLTNVRMQKCEL